MESESNAIVDVIFDSPEYREMLEVRDTVLRKPLGLRFNPDILDTEDCHHHMALKHNGKFVATLILNEIEGDWIKMRQVAVLPDFQGKGFGKVIVEAGENKARSIGARYVYCHARDTAVPFYRSRGYKTAGDQFIEIGIPHFRMEKTL
jgi:predicted GNAT family N-acyltransferase